MIYGLVGGESERMKISKRIILLCALACFAGILLDTYFFPMFIADTIVLGKNVKSCHKTTLWVYTAPSPQKERMLLCHR